MHRLPPSGEECCNIIYESIIQTSGVASPTSSPSFFHRPPNTILVYTYTIYRFNILYKSLRPRIILHYYYFFTRLIQLCPSAPPLINAQTLALVHSTAINLSLSDSVARVIRSFNLSSRVRRQTTTTTTTTTTLASPSSVVK